MDRAGRNENVNAMRIGPFYRSVYLLDILRVAACQPANYRATIFDRLLL